MQYFGATFLCKINFSVLLQRKPAILISLWFAILTCGRPLTWWCVSQFDVGVIYDEPRHALINKWLLLSNQEEEYEGVKGFLKICAAVLGPNDDAPVCNLPWLLLRMIIISCFICIFTVVLLLHSVCVVIFRFVCVFCLFKCRSYISVYSLSLMLLYYYCLWAMLPDSKWMNEWMNEL